MIPEAKTPVQPFQIPLVNEAEVVVVEEEGDEEFPLVGDAGAPTFEDHAVGDVGEELAAPLLPLLRHQQLQQPRQLQHTRPTASLSKGQLLRIPLHRRRDRVRWHLVQVVLSCRDMATLVIQWHVMIVRRLGIHPSKVQKTAQPDHHLTRPRALTVSSPRLLHERWRVLCLKFELLLNVNCIKWK